MQNDASDAKLTVDPKALDSNQQIMHEIQKAGYNIVTCGNCGDIRLHRTWINELDCESCGMVSDISDFPDLFVVD